MAASKVQPKEYDGVGDSQTPEAQAARSEQQNAGMGVGQYATKTYYTDADGKVTTTEPERGSVLVAQGDLVTQAVADQLGSK